MTLVEVAAGVLILAGVSLRPLSLVLLAAFIFFAALLPESYTSHILFYGVMLSFLFNAAGHWRVPAAQDKAAEIVIIGGGFSAISAATRIEKLIGPYTRVNLTLVHESSNMLFYPLLPEVVSGGMQPGNVVNPIRRIIPQTRVLSGKLRHVNDRTKRVAIRRKNGRGSLCSLTINRFWRCFWSRTSPLSPGANTHSQPIDFVGDALHIRKRVLDLIEDAELVDDLDERRRLLTFAVVGSGQRSCSTAVELCEMLRAAEASYPVLRQHGWRVYLYEDTHAPFTDFEAEIQSQRNRELEKAGVTLCSNDRIVGLTDRDIRLASGRTAPGRHGGQRIVQAADDRAERTGISLAAGGGRRLKRQGAPERLVGRRHDARGPRSFQYDGRFGRLGKRRGLQRLGWFAGLSKPEILAA